jgi:hypothetical protein
MPKEHLGNYDIEYNAVRLAANSNDWAATVAIFGPSSNPMHRNPVFPSQRVLIDTVFHDEKSAEQEARKAALAMIERH